MVHLCKVFIQDSGFHVAYVQITAWLRWKACNDLAINSVLKTECKACRGLVGTRFVSFSTGDIRL